MKHTYTVDTWVGDGTDCKVTFDYYPGRPGVYSGPPERCYEDEPDELEVTSITVDGHPFWPTDAQREDLENRLYEEGRERVSERYEPERNDQ